MKIGIIGLGTRSKKMAGLFTEHDPTAKITALIDRDPAQALEKLPEDQREGVTVYSNVEEMMAKGQPDGIMIGTRCDSHTPYAIEAARYSVPIFLEKPVATHMEQALALEDAFSRSSAPVLVSFPLRASTICTRIKKMLDRGVIGRIEHVLASNYVHYGSVYFGGWYRDYQTTQGLFLQKATHDFDYLSHLVDSPIVRVAAMSSRGRVYRDTSTKGSTPDPNSAYYEGIGTPETGMNEDSSSALLEFANGVQGVYTQVFYCSRYPSRGAKFSGYHGTLDFDWRAGKITTYPNHEEFVDVSTIEKQGSHFGGDDVLAKNFLAMIRSNAPSIAPIQTGLESVYACLAAKESAETGRFIDVRQVGC